MHASKAAEGMLSSQQLGSTMSAALAPAALAASPSDGCMRFGDVVMLSTAGGGVLAVNTRQRTDSEQEAYVVTRTSAEAGVACTRSAWTITPVGDAPADGYLRFGMKFALSTAGPDGAPLYLQSLRYTLTNLNYSGSGGVGAGVSAVPALTADTTWSVVLLDPRDLDKMEAHDQPVPANTFVALEHANTATLLYTHEFKVRARPPSSRRWHERARAREAQ